MKPGYKTTEFWTTLITQALTLLLLTGLVSSQDARTLENALTQCVSAVCLLLTNGWVVVRYIQARVAVKTGSASGAAGVPTVLPLVLLVLVLLPGSAQAQLSPWRRQVEQRLQQQQQQISALLQRPQAPAPAPPSQAPQIIIHPPYQQLPIPGGPQQLLPIQGDPRQQLPIEGAPKQHLPIPGQPQQQLPIAGPPQQQLPIQGPLPQQMPLAPPDATQAQQPQRYSVIRALWRSS